MFKICITCKLEKPVEQFRKDRNQCKLCRALIVRNNYEKNRDKLLEYKKKHYLENKRRYRSLNKAWYQENKEVNDAYTKKYRDVNKEKVLQRTRQYRRHKRATDVQFRLVENLRSRLRQALNFNLKSKGTLELLGCSVVQLKTHLENLFLPGMSWGNYGYYGWHIDHIIPCVYFDLSKEEEQRKCFNYINLQPLWQKDNFNKRTKIILQETK